MHTMWKGAISFGLVHIPVKMHAATEDKSPKFRYLHKLCNTPIQYVKRCPFCGVDVEWEEIIRGYEYEEGRFMILDEEELEELKGERSRTIEITDFVDLKEIDPIYFHHSYYLSPQEGGGKAYKLLHQAMEVSGRIAVAKVSLRSKENLAALRAYGKVLVLETLFFPDEIRDVNQVPVETEAVKVEEREISMATQLIDQLTAPFEPEKYKDPFRQALEEHIKEKVPVEGPERPDQTANIIDLMEALKKSLEVTSPSKGRGKSKGRRKKVSGGET
ncbi:Ku protein [Thermicanus aegyptius]|uniref:non-homologous end joining protein Ku n=1 Tax=Thermicanus aegyptius TaxID=94009 RepID=UPI00041D4DC5|nr:Ku protein [Thermicanus aegyptius]